MRSHVSTIACFEFALATKRISTWVYFVVFFGSRAVDGRGRRCLFERATSTSAATRCSINSPFALAQTVARARRARHRRRSPRSSGRAVQQDFEYRTAPLLLHARRSRKRDYLVGRFLGALAMLLRRLRRHRRSASSSATHCCPAWSRARSARPLAAPTLAPYLVVLLPNVLLIGAVFFGLAAPTRKMLPVYVGGVVVLVG